MLNKKLKEIYRYIFAEDEEFSLEHRLFIYSLGLGTLIGITATLVSILVSTSVISIISCLIITLIIQITYFLARYKKIIEPLIIPLIIIVYLGSFMIWLWVGGLESQNMVPIIVILLTSLIIVQKRFRKFVFLFFQILILIVYFIQLNYPNMLIQYPSESSRWIDSLITTMYSALGIYLIVKFVQKKYGEEKDKAKENEQKFRTLIEQSKEAIGITDIEGNFLIVNYAFCKMTGFTEKELLAMNAFTIQNQVTIDQIRNSTELKKEPFRFTIIRKDKQEIVIELNTSIVSINNIEYIMGSARDITERVKAESIINTQNIKLAQLNDEKDRLFSILAHDLRSPFTSIMGFTELLSKNVRNYDIEKIEKHLTIVNKTVVNTFNLLEDLLLWSKIKSGKLSLSYQDFTARIICEETLENFQELAGNKGVTINLYCRDDISMYGDLFSVKTILRNIISNAIKFSYRNNSIDVHVFEKHSNVIFSITDFGIGMNDEKINSLLDNNNTLSSKGTEDEVGTGFGLSICLDLIKINDGSIEIQSKVSRGSTFILTFPKHKNSDN